jgi:hypothetical protein
MAEPTVQQAIGQVISFGGVFFSLDMFFSYVLANRSLSLRKLTASGSLPRTGGASTVASSSVTPP